METITHIAISTFSENSLYPDNTIASIGFINN